MKKFSSPYKEIRVGMELYQWEMAELLGCTEYRYKLYELGYAKMPVRLQIKILSFDKTGKYASTIDYLKKLEEIKRK